MTCERHLRGPARLGLSATVLLAGCSVLTPTLSEMPRQVTVRALPDRSGMAPDDAGDPALHHDHRISVAGQVSTFVWIPRFEAVQLRVPAAAGYPGYPTGAWVKDARSGTEGVDWIRERFGGFYAGKYEASQVDGRVVVRAGDVPWGDVTWTEAERASSEMVPGKSHLLRGDEWTAMAVWAMIHDVDVRGNTENGRDALSSSVLFETTASGVALTGSGRPAPGGDGNLSPTSHTGRADGVLDLVGNLREWDGSLTMKDHEYLVDGGTTGLGGTLPGYVATLLLDPVLRKQGVTGSTASAPSGFFTGDAYHTSGYSAPGASSHGSPAGPDKLLYTNRGGAYDRGHFDEPAQAGLWLLCVNRDAAYHAPQQGFRPALTY